MVTRNALQFIKQVNYGLKRNYGLPLDVYHNTENTVNPETGKRTVNRIVYHIDKAIILASDLMPKIIPGGIGHFNQNTTIDVTDKIIIVDTVDLPSGYVPNDTDYVVINHGRYEIVKIEVFEDIRSLVMKVRLLKGQAPNEIHILRAKSKLRFTQLMTKV